MRAEAAATGDAMAAAGADGGGAGRPSPVPWGAMDVGGQVLRDSRGRAFSVASFFAGAPLPGAAATSAAVAPATATATAAVAATSAAVAPTRWPREHRRHERAATTLYLPAPADALDAREDEDDVEAVVAPPPPLLRPPPSHRRYLPRLPSRLGRASPAMRESYSDRVTAALRRWVRAGTRLGAALGCPRMDTSDDSTDALPAAASSDDAAAKRPRHLAAACGGARLDRWPVALAVVLLGALLLYLTHWHRAVHAQELPATLPPLPRRLRELFRPQTVFHVTREFGPARTGGLGTVVTALAAHQRERGLDARVVMPYYYFLEHLRPAYFATVTVAYRAPAEPGGAALAHVSSQVAALAQRLLAPTARAAANGSGVPWSPSPAPPLLAEQPAPRWPLWPHDRNATAVAVARASAEPGTLRADVYTLTYQSTPVYLIAPGYEPPFDRAFFIKNPRELYNVEDALPHDLRDGYFTAAVAQLLWRLHDEVPAPVVHVHGATNALVLPLMRADARWAARRVPPAFVYTIHDYHDEVIYGINVDVMRRFVDFPFPSAADLYAVRWTDVILSAYSVRFADVVTCVSRQLARDLVNDRLRDLDNQDIVLPVVQAKARQRRLVGVPNGVDLSAFNPFDNPLLRAEHLEFDSSASIAAKKAQAKLFLCRNGVIPRAACRRPLVLFIGRFEKAKGMWQCADVSEILDQEFVTFVMMGQPIEKTRPLTAIVQGNGGIILDDPELQRRYGAIVRAAADIAFVPSIREGFGLVAAEGLSFGSIVVTSGTGGLRDFLVDRHAVEVPGDHNAYFFDVDRPAKLAEAMAEALEFLRTLEAQPILYESYLRQLIDDAQTLGWNRRGGPVDLYVEAYTVAMASAAQADFDADADTATYGYASLAPTAFL